MAFAPPIALLSGQSLTDICRSQYACQLDTERRQKGRDPLTLLDTLSAENQHLLVVPRAAVEGVLGLNPNSLPIETQANGQPTISRNFPTVTTPTGKIAASFIGRMHKKGKVRFYDSVDAFLQGEDIEHPRGGLVVVDTHYTPVSENGTELRERFSHSIRDLVDGIIKYYVGTEGIFCPVLVEDPQVLSGSIMDRTYAHHTASRKHTEPFALTMRESAKYLSQLQQLPSEAAHNIYEGSKRAHETGFDNDAYGEPALLHARHQVKELLSDWFKLRAKEHSHAIPEPDAKLERGDQSILVCSDHRFKVFIYPREHPPPHVHVVTHPDRKGKVRYGRFALCEDPIHKVQHVETMPYLKDIKFGDFDINDYERGDAPDPNERITSKHSMHPEELMQAQVFLNNHFDEIWQAWQRIMAEHPNPGMHRLLSNNDVSGHITGRM